ncbi:C1 family peptidase [Halobacteriovorax sp. HLS]|uniref:C1 family peptidase n=1 Tax=Halobacteriovorax sp. HLS TaxID=2234000 RepID=UPI000FD7DB6F|nr:C1 family peptidase [Halobacteriovorax sp. HLS]
MKKIFILHLLLTSAYIHSATQSEIIISNLWKNIGHQLPANITKKPIVKKPAKKETKVQEDQKTSQKLSPGQLKIEQMKKANRDRLQKMNQKNKETNTSKSDSKGSIYQQAQEGLAQMKRMNKQTLSSWKEQERQTLEQWKKKRQEFLSRVKIYKNNTFELESTSQSFALKKWETDLAQAPASEYFIVKDALEINIRDQGNRPTCSAFAGTRAIEIALAQKGAKTNLSEQYIYWASKPYCQTSPCNKKGSWISYAYDDSINSKEMNIPSEKDCPYVSTPIAGNETQIPFKQSCSQGIVKVNSYKKINSTKEIFETLNNNIPIVAGFKLSPNFYKTNGIISYKDSLVNGRMDEHANGHALLIVGYMRVPKNIREEGNDCFIVANSWSEGWATGGYGCVTQKWLNNYKVPNPFLAITSIKE